MALGGGVWAVQNKVLPGTYINFSSVAKASATLSDRGYAALPLMLDWGPDNQIFTVTGADFQKDSLKIFGYPYTDGAMLPLRELFQNAHTLYAFRLNGGGDKAANDFCAANYSGTVGNKLSTVIALNVDDETLFDVSTYYDTTLIETQTVANAAALVANDFVTFKATATLAATARTALTGGTNGASSNTAIQAFLDRLESYSFNALGCPFEDTTTIGLFVNYTRRMRDEVGAKFQTVIYNAYGNVKLADYEGIVEVGNGITGFDTSLAGFGQFGLIYWVTGAIAGCAVNKSNTNITYNGELTVNVNFTQSELISALKAGRFMLHNVNGDVRVLEDINSFVTVSDTKGDVFKSNQTIRVCDEIANDIAVIFNTRYLGRVPNDAEGRIALWNDVCKLLMELETIRAIEDFDTDDVTIEQGETKKAVVCTVNGLNIINAMAQLYMSVVVM